VIGNQSAPSMLSLSLFKGKIRSGVYIHDRDDTHKGKTLVFHNSSD